MTEPGREEPQADDPKARSEATEPGREEPQADDPKARSEATEPGREEPQADDPKARSEATEPGPGGAASGRPESEVYTVIPLSTLVVVLIACVVAQAFFASAEVALGACDRGALRARAAAGGTAAARIEQLLAVPRVTLATTLVGANLATLIAVIGVAMHLGVGDRSPWWALLVVPPLLVVGHLVPKAIVQAHADRVVDISRVRCGSRRSRCARSSRSSAATRSCSRA